VVLHNDVVQHTWSKSTNKRKVLCLHGGGGSSTSLRAQMESLINNDQLTNYEFIFADTPEDGNLWIRDPPGGKDSPTTNESWASASVDYLNNLTGNDTYYALLGYSQGGAMAAVYLSNVVRSKFQKVLFFSGYLPSTHTGLVNKIDYIAPFDIPALIYRGRDDFISSTMISELATKFVSPIVIDSNQGGHNVPNSSNVDFAKVVNFLTT